jgi:hypothetical protein
METNWIIIGIVVLLAIALVIFLIKRNLKDKEEMEKFFNEEYKTTPKEESEFNDGEK